MFTYIGITGGWPKGPAECEGACPAKQAAQEFRGLHKGVINSNTPRSRNVDGTNIQTGAKFCEDRGGEPLGEDICVLRRCRNVEDADISKGDPFTDKVKVDFHVLGALMLNGVGGEVDGADIVAVDEGGSLQGVVQLLEKLLQP